MGLHPPYGWRKTIGGCSIKEEQKTCFITMPIATPEPFVEKYRDGADHFKHVLDHLLIPSVEKAGYQPRPPKAKGSDLIHVGIIRPAGTRPPQADPPV